VQKFTRILATDLQQPTIAQADQSPRHCVAQAEAGDAAKDKYD
jgi:hypothetical protein